MLLANLVNIPADTRKVDAIQNYHGHISTTDIPAIIASIKADTYKVDALNELLSREAFDPQDALNAIRTIRADTYIVDAINAIVSHYPILNSTVALHLFSLIGADTYKVDSLDSLAPSLESKQVVTIIHAISADTHRLDALKKLADKIDGKDVITLVSSFSGSYQSDVIEMLQPLVRDEDVVAFTSVADKAISLQEENTYISGEGNIIFGDIIENTDYSRIFSLIDNQSNMPYELNLRNVYQNMRENPITPKPVKRFEYPDKLDDDTKVKEDDDKDVCAVCADYYHRTINLPCMHACLCFHCAKVIGESEKKQCPVCRTPLEAIKTVFKS